MAREILAKTDIPNSAFYRRMGIGHYERKGHPLAGYLVWYKGDVFNTLIRTCCKETGE